MSSMFSALKNAVGIKRSSSLSNLNSYSDRVISCSHDNVVKIWNLSTAKLECSFAGHERAVYTVQLLCDGRIASGGYDTIIRIWDRATGKCDMKLMGHTDSIYCLFVLPDNRLVSGASDKTMRVWNLKSKKCEAILTGHTAGILHAVYIPGINCIASAAVDKTIRIWNCSNFKVECVLQGHSNTVCGLAVLSDGRLASCSHDETIKIWSLHLGHLSNNSEAPGKAEERVLWSLDHSWRAHTAAIQSILILSDDRLASCSRDATIKIWHTATLKCVATLAGHSKDINALCLLADSNKLISASSDCTIRLWDLDNNGKCDAVITNANNDGKSFVLYALSTVTEELKQYSAAKSAKKSDSKNNLANMASPSKSTMSNSTPTPGAQPNNNGSNPAAAGTGVNNQQSLMDAAEKERKKRQAQLQAAKSQRETDEWASLGIVTRDDLHNMDEEEKQEKIDTDEEEKKRFAPILLPTLQHIQSVNPSTYSVITKYQQQHYLSYTDYITDLFYDDGGFIAGVNSAKVGKERETGAWEGEIIMINRACDQLLNEVILTAKKLVCAQTDVRSRIQILAQFVSNKLGGMPNDIVSVWEKTMQKARRWKDTIEKEQSLSPELSNNKPIKNITLPMGALIGECGLTRHRAVLFKYLCDQTVLHPEEWSYQPVIESSRDYSFSMPFFNSVNNDSANAAHNSNPAIPENSPNNAAHVHLTEFYDSKDTQGGDNTAPGISIHPAEKENSANSSNNNNNNNNNNHGGNHNKFDVETDQKPEFPSQLGRQPSSPMINEELSIKCRLIRGQYQYYVPRSKKSLKKDSSNSADEKEYHRIGGYHAWNVVQIGSEHYVVDLIFETGQLYLESCRDAMHYNRGRRGNARKTGLTSLPVRDVREIDWSELTDVRSLKDGGFGKVEQGKYKGIDVVIKTPLNTSDTYVTKQFHEEARVLNCLSHPNIVQLIGVSSVRQAIILEYVSGGDVHNWLKSHAKNNEPISLLERLDVLIQSALAMQYLHGCEPPIVHRDLKTLNLLIQKLPIPGGKTKNIIKVCDFGLARNQRKDEGISTDHRDMGTPAYQSPEQWEGENISEKTDVYSFSSIMLEVLTDRIPWHTAKNKYEIYQAVVVNKTPPPIPPPLSKDYTIPDLLVNLIKVCHTTDANDRPAFPAILGLLRDVQDQLVLNNTA
jgi:WD40 repeat protein/tRNA A-37 threonylcarbamoyl transferase component Bud32